MPLVEVGVSTGVVPSVVYRILASEVEDTNSTEISPKADGGVAAKLGASTCPTLKVATATSLVVMPSFSATAVILIGPDDETSRSAGDTYRVRVAPSSSVLIAK